MPSSQGRSRAQKMRVMSHPRIYLWRMLLCLMLTLPLAIVLWGPLAKAFMANIGINAVILGAFFVGILYAFRRVSLLTPEIRWVNAFRWGEPGFAVPKRTTLLAPMAALLRERKGPVTLPATTTRAILDSIGMRLDETRDISRYLIGLLIFLGLLGTFWGLLQTVSAVGDTMRSFSVGPGPADAMFEELRTGLEAPLAGMGTAFSSSLFGLGGSLILGFLDLQAAQAQNRFYNELEEWLSSVTSVTEGRTRSEAEDEEAETVIAALQRASKSIDTLRRTVSSNEKNRVRNDEQIAELTARLGDLATSLEDRGRPQETGATGAENGFARLERRLVEVGDVLRNIEARSGDGAEPRLQSLNTHLSRIEETLEAGSERGERLAAQVEDRLGDLIERLSSLSEVLESDHGVLARLAENQEHLGSLIEAQTEPAMRAETALGHLRNMDETSRALLNETMTAREETIQQLRQEIRLMAKTVAALIVEGRKEPKPAEAQSSEQRSSEHRSQESERPEQSGYGIAARFTPGGRS